jgi:hypothetical protein
MCVKQLTYEARNFFGYLVEVSTSGLGIFVQCNALLDTSNCRKRQRNRFNFILTLRGK